MPANAGIQEATPLAEFRPFVTSERRPLGVAASCPLWIPAYAYDKLRFARSTTSRGPWIASSQGLLAMTMIAPSVSKNLTNLLSENNKPCYV
jgi:hypothetical protein